MIELRHIRYFLAAAEHGSFRKAALALATQESSISRRIRDLEDRLGASLFQRHSGGVVLTLAGHELLHQARTAMKHLGEGVRDVRSIGRNESGHLRVGVHSTLAFGFLADLFQTYAVDARGVRIDFSDGATTDHVAAVRLHQLDIAFVVGTQDRVGCKTMSLWVEKVFAVLPSDHVLANQLSVGWQDLLNEEFIVSEQAQGREIQEFLIGRLSGLGQSPQVRGQNVGRDNLMSLVAIGRGLTLTTEATIFTDFPGLTYRPIEGETLTFSAVWLPANDNPALRQLLSMALARRKAAGFHGLTTTFPTDPPPAALSRIPDPWP